MVFDDAAVLVPMAFVAVTINVYCVVLSPVMVTLVVVPLVVTDVIEGLEKLQK